MGPQLALKATPQQPQFLTDIEQYIERELHELQTMGDAGNPEAVAEQRLDIFRNAFEMFISKLSTYQPLLSEINKEYDNAIRNLRREVMHFMATKSELGTLKERTVVLVNKLKAEYTKKLREVQDASAAKDAKLRQLYGETRAAKHEAEKALELQRQAQDRSMEQHESNATLMRHIQAKETELTEVADTAAERDLLLVKNAELEEKIQTLQTEAAALANEKEEKHHQLQSANKHNEELLAQLNDLNEKYAEAAVKLEESAENWQSRTKNAINGGGETPRPNMDALNSSLAARTYMTPKIPTDDRSTIEVVGQLYWEIDRLCATLNHHAIPLANPDGNRGSSREAENVPQYLKSRHGPLGQVPITSPEELLTIAKDFWVFFSCNNFEGRRMNANQAFAVFMDEKFPETSAEMSHSVCEALLSSSVNSSRECSLLLKLLQDDPEMPLSTEILVASTEHTSMIGGFAKPIPTGAALAP